MPRSARAPLQLAGCTTPRAASSAPGRAARVIAFVLGDDRVLTVDLSGLPARFGADDQRRSDLTCGIVADVSSVQAAMSDRTARLAGPFSDAREMIAAGRPFACRSVTGRAAV